MAKENFSEVVVECGCEGGSITVLRRRDSHGAWRYWVESDEQLAVALLDDEDRQGLQPHAMSATVSSLQEALRDFPSHSGFPPAQTVAATWMSLAPKQPLQAGDGGSCVQ